MSAYLLLAAWLFAGCLGFFAARAALEWSVCKSLRVTPSCRPVTVGTLIGMLFLMWIPPLSLLAALIWWLKGVSEGGYKWSRIVVFTPCKYFRTKP